MEIYQECLMCLAPHLQHVWLANHSCVPCEPRDQQWKIGHLLWTKDTFPVTQNISVITKFNSTWNKVLEISLRGQMFYECGVNFNLHFRFS